MKQRWYGVFLTLLFPAAIMDLPLHSGFAVAARAERAFHMLAGRDRTAWRAFLNTVRTERFNDVLGLKQVVSCPTLGL
jgi:hypothetical protein